MAHIVCLNCGAPTEGVEFCSPDCHAEYVLMESEVEPLDDDELEDLIDDDEDLWDEWDEDEEEEDDDWPESGDIFNAEGEDDPF